MLVLHIFPEVQEMEQNLPKNCKVNFPDPHKLHSFKLTISPDEGYWNNGLFVFRITVPEEYNIVVSSLNIYADIYSFSIIV